MFDTLGGGRQLIVPCGSQRVTTNSLVSSPCRLSSSRIFPQSFPLLPRTGSLGCTKDLTPELSIFLGPGL